MDRQTFKKTMKAAFRKSRHTVRDSKTGRFIKKERTIQFVCGIGAYNELNRIFSDEIEKMRVEYESPPIQIESHGRTKGKSKGYIKRVGKF